MADEEQVESKKEKLKEFDIAPTASQLMNIVQESLQVNSTKSQFISIQRRYTRL